MTNDEMDRLLRLWFALELTDEEIDEFLATAPLEPDTRTPEEVRAEVLAVLERARGE